MIWFDLGMGSEVKESFDWVEILVKKTILFNLIELMHDVVLKSTDFVLIVSVGDMP